jgi:hypothetical protein
MNSSHRSYRTEIDQEALTFRDIRSSAFEYAAAEARTLCRKETDLATRHPAHLWERSRGTDEDSICTCIPLFSHNVVTTVTVHHLS